MPKLLRAPSPIADPLIYLQLAPSSSTRTEPLAWTTFSIHTTAFLSSEASSPPASCTSSPAPTGSRQRKLALRTTSLLPVTSLSRIQGGRNGSPRSRRRACGLESATLEGGLDLFLSASDEEADLFLPYSAHQMGSCQMSAKATQGVVDPRGRVWGTEGLWIADASIFPTASAVNPMITVSQL